MNQFSGTKEKALWYLGSDVVAKYIKPTPEEPRISRAVLIRRYSAAYLNNAHFRLGDAPSGSAVPSAAGSTICMVSTGFGAPG